MNELMTPRYASMLVFCALALGCWSYGVVYRLADSGATARPISQSEVDRAIAVMEGIAERWEMILESPPGEGYEWPEGDRVLIGYHRFQGALRHRPAADVYFSALLGPGGTYLQFTIHDVERGMTGKTKGQLVEALDRELEPAIRAAFPDRKIERWEGEYGPEFFAG